ncbi:SURF1 family cytochrome oxidase biogenesis protein [Novosphingobium sp.]|uniref:SURF1 family cytochrome oxidase biogenesis protein n=1 Tax=Novosphingobium sp. TaxID=1874826 RepID=UPI00286E0DAA|nr:SURF1 family cytochrome oxidase biogenesis protein [Novosphingobium sp.]
MIRRLPVIPTVVVLIAVAIMIRLGFWQLDRLGQKESQMLHYEAAQNLPIAPLGVMPGDDTFLFRRAALFCKRVESYRDIAGRSSKGESGWARVAHCVTGGDVVAPTIGDAMQGADITLGWSRDLVPVKWEGGQVLGVIVPGANHVPRLVADPPLAGLQASARPDPKDVPNNHLAYAVQWFLFAGIALVIYLLAVRKRLAARDERG